MKMIRSNSVLEIVVVDANNENQNTHNETIRRLVFALNLKNQKL